MGIDPTSMHALLARLEAARELVAKFPVSAPNGSVAAPSAPGAAAKPLDFGALLKASVDRVDQGQNHAMALAERFQLGDPKVSLEETMVSLSKANISFQQMVQVRNRMIQAYHDIMNLQV
jgi:flagellar hook-basal body complex protein FliE